MKTKEEKGTMVIPSHHVASVFEEDTGGFSVVIDIPPVVREAQKSLIESVLSEIGEDEPEQVWVGIGTANGDGTIDLSEAITINQERQRIRSLLQKRRDEV